MDVSYTLVLAADPELGGGSGVFGLSPPVLFFALGVLASLVKSNLRMPKALTKGLSLYLMWAIGFKGGVELARDGLSTQGLVAIGLAVAFAFLVPLGCFPVLRRLTDRANAAALTAVYGSVSVVTFLTAVAMLRERGIESGGHMVAAMTLMEFPAIVVGVALLRMGDAPTPGEAPGRRWGFLLHESLLNGPVLLLLGSLTIGVLTGEHGYRVFKPLCNDVFPGVLAFFLLDMGLLAAARLRDILTIPKSLVVFGVAAPVINGILALGAAKALGVGLGDGILLGVLAGSASYIAAPAALRLAVPQAKPSLYISLALGVTFPFNITVGIPLLAGIAQRIW